MPGGEDFVWAPPSAAPRKAAKFGAETPFYGGVLSGLGWFKSTKIKQSS